MEYNYKGHNFSYAEYAEDVKEYLDLERHLWWVIKNSDNPDEKSKIKRFNKALKAVYGDEHYKMLKAPEPFSYDDMKSAYQAGKQNKNKEGAIKDLIKDRFPDLDENTDIFIAKLKTIKQHFKRASHIYDDELKIYAMGDEDI